MVKIENEDILYRINDEERLVIKYFLMKSDHTTYYAEIPLELFNANRISDYVDEYFIRFYLEEHFELVRTPEIRLHVRYPFTVEEICL